MANGAHPVVGSRSVARQPNKPKKGETYRMHIILPGEVVAEIDALAEKLSAARPGLAVTRTDVVRMAVHQFIELERKNK